MPKFDYGGFVVGGRCCETRAVQGLLPVHPDKPEEAHLLGKSEGVIAGVPFATGASCPVYNSMS
jgi:hypothetical protein